MGARTNDTPTCFVMMPFGGRFKVLYTEVYLAAIEDAGLHPVRGDDMANPGAIVHQIWAQTRDAKIVVADLSEGNPNVFYELGLAHALGKPAILTADRTDDLPFDVRHLRTLGYDKDHPSWGAKLRTQLTKAIQETLESPERSTMPKYDTRREWQADDEQRPWPRPIDIPPPRRRLHRPARLLWVDDTPENNAFEEHSLRSYGIKIDRATSTKDALSMMDENAYDLIISDVVRTEGGRRKADAGYELLRNVRNRNDGAPFIFYTGSRTSVDGRRTRGAAVTDHPVQLEQLVMDQLSRRGDSGPPP